MIKTIPDGQLITEPGAYRLSMSWYHSQCCDGPSISSSGLRTIVNESPWHFWCSSDLNPERLPETDDSAALILGKAAHAIVLGDEVFDDHFIYEPEDAPRKPTSQQLDAYDDGRATEVGKRSVEFWRAFDERASGRLLLTQTQVEHIAHMARNLKACPEAVEALTGQMTEVSMIWRDEATGVWIKSRPDVIPDNGADFADLKTFAPRSKSIKRAVQQAITDHAYHMQMALAVEGAERVFGNSAAECVLIMAQSNPPYTVTPVRLDEDALYWGRVMNRHGIDTFARCLKEGRWPQPVEGIMDYTIPDSVMHRLGDMQIRGELPSIGR